MLNDQNPKKINEEREALDVDWRQEFRRAVALDVLPEDKRNHITDHGLDPEVKISGSDPSYCDTCGSGGSIDITVQGACPCGASVWASVDGEEDVAGLIRRITTVEIQPQRVAPVGDQEGHK